MSSIAVVTDSNAGISKEIADSLGVRVVPMPFMINDKTYFENITLSRDEFYEKLAEGENIVTSQPSPECIMELWNELLQEHDEVVHIPMSSGLSGSCATAHMLAKEYEGRVHVVNNQRISVTQFQSVVDALELAGRGKSGKEIQEILEADKYNSTIYIMLDTLYYLKKGGRITPAAAALGTILKLKPVLQIQGEKLDAFAKARTVTQAKSIMTNAVKNDIETRFKAEIHQHRVTVFIAHTQNLGAAETLRSELEETFPGYDIRIADLSLSVACHIGPGALAIACTKNLEY